MILSAVLHEQEMPTVIQKALPSIWDDLLQYIFRAGKENHNRLQNNCVSVINGSSKEDGFTNKVPTLQSLSHPTAINYKAPQNIDLNMFFQDL